MADIRQCPFCGTNLPEGATICPECCCDVTDQDGEERCPACGAKITPSMEACAECGASLRRRWFVSLHTGYRLVAALLVLALLGVVGYVLLSPWAEPLPLSSAVEPAVASPQTGGGSVLAATVTPMRIPSATPLDRERVAETEGVGEVVQAAASPTMVVRNLATPTVPEESRAVEPSWGGIGGPLGQAETMPRSPIVHVVQRGDVLSRIAVQYQVDAETIAEANGISVDSVLSLGQELVIPQPEADEASSQDTEATPLLSTVTPSATAEPTPTPVPRVHVVARGDTLGGIAVQYDVASEAIAEANDISLSSVLSLGQELIIPASEEGDAPVVKADGTPTPMVTAVPSRTPEATPTPVPKVHVVAQGDSLGGIAVQYDLEAERIAAANGISVDSVLSLGQELAIPDTTAEPTPTLSPTPTTTMEPSPTPFVLKYVTRRYPYNAPSLLYPGNGHTVTDGDTPVILSWSSVGILGEDEWYLLRLWTPQEGLAAREIWVKTTSWRVPVELYPEGRRSSRFRWDVVVVGRGVGGEDVQPLSPYSKVYCFVWE